MSRWASESSRSLEETTNQWKAWGLLHARKGRRKGRVHTKAKAEKEMRKEPPKRRMLSCSVALLIYGLAGAFGPSGGQAERDLRVASDGFRSQADYGCTRASMHELTSLACHDMELRALGNGKRRSMRRSSAPSEELVRRETEIGVGGGMKWRQGGGGRKCTDVGFGARG